MRKRMDDFGPTPGMPADVYIKTGERTFFEYIMRPVLDSFSRAFRETYREGDRRSAAPLSYRIQSRLRQPRLKSKNAWPIGHAVMMTNERFYRCGVQKASDNQALRFRHGKPM